MSIKVSNLLKFRGSRVFIIIFSLTCTALAGGIAHLAAADDKSPWLTSPLYLSKVKDVTAAGIPSTFWGTGNTDCAAIYGGICSIDTPYGSVSGSSVWLGGQWRAIEDYAGNGLNFFAIPNSDTAFTTSSPPGFGSYVYFTDDVSLALTPHYAVGSPNLGGGLSYLQLNRPYDRKLSDKSGKQLIADLNSVAFSGNSQWMAVTDPNTANLRVNINTGEVLPFGQPFTYGHGLNPVPKNAITSDGRYALQATRDSTAFTVYDLSTCAPPPDRITGQASCGNRELIYSGYLSSQIPGYSGTLYARFLNDDTLSFYASYKEGSATKFALYTLSTSPDTSSGMQYLALGDSYISGEGTFNYVAGTDTDADKCHLSLFSYPFLIGRDINIDSYNSAACSGATTDDVINMSDSYDGQTAYNLTKEQLENTPQFDNLLNSFSPGWVDQLEFVKKYQPHAITISIGGNDMGFSKILYRCIKPSPPDNTCYNTYEDRLELVNSINDTVFPNLVKTYALLKQSGPPDMRVYTIGYPQIALPGGDCAVNVQLNNDELVFAQQLISYLDGVIKYAAGKVGVKYVDTQDALAGHRLCEAGPGSIAMNGLTAGDDRPSILGGPIGDESYHPNKLGYRLLEEKILAETSDLSDTMPAADPAASPPGVSPALEMLSNVPHSGRSIKTLQYDPSITTDFAYRGTPITINLNGTAHSLAAGTSLKAELHSDPINLGAFQTGGDRNLITRITIPPDAEAGYHVLHFYGSDMANRPVDIYKTIYVAASADDIDGNGTPDSRQSCVGIPESGQDYDGDGFDDACDSYIGLPPAKPHVPKNIESALASTTASSSDADSSNDTSPVQPTITDPQAQTGASEITLADSSSDISKPAVLAAETTAPKSSGATIGNKYSASSYWLVTAGLSAIAVLSYAAKRWLF